MSERQLTGLEMYRHDIVTNPLRLEVFIADLLEENFDDRDEALAWLDNQFVPAFVAAIGDMDIDGEGPDIPL